MCKRLNALWESSRDSKERIVKGDYEIAPGQIIPLEVYAFEDTIQRLCNYFRQCEPSGFRMQQIVVKHNKPYIYFYYPVGKGFFSSKKYYLGKHWDTDDWDKQMERIIETIRRKYR